MKDLMGAPIEYDRAVNGYRYRTTDPRFELPGLWLNESELYALLATERLLEQMQPGLLAPYVGPLRARIRALLAQTGHSAATVSERILLHSGTDPAHLLPGSHQPRQAPTRTLRNSRGIK
jgi:predicted DNA-binding transcriptional regulator YafY